MSKNTSLNDSKVEKGEEQHSPTFENEGVKTEAYSAHSSDVDVGYGLFIKGEREHVGEGEGDRKERDRLEEEAWKRVLRKIDLRVLPLICIIYMVQYTDKLGINYSNIFGFQTSLHMKGQQYSWVSSIFYFGYLIAQYPMAWLMQRLPIGRFLALLIFLWSVVLMSTAGCTNFAGAMANRFFLGVLESSVTPAFVLMTGMWWTAAEQPFRQLTWYSFQAWAGILGSLIGYGVGHIHGGLADWTYIYLILGAIGVVLSIFVALYLADSPVSAPFLTEEERVVAVRRVARNKTGIENKHFKWYQIREAVTDPKIYILFLMSLAAQIPNGMLTSFQSVIIEGLGFSVLETTLLSIPSNVIQGVLLIAAGYTASKISNSRVIIMTIGNVTCIIAAAVMAYLPVEHQWGRLIAFWFTPLQSIGFSLSLIMVTVNMGGYTKRAFAGATTFIGYCVGNIAGPFFVFPDQAPQYLTAIKAMLVGYVIKTAAGLVLGAYMYFENRRRDRRQRTEGPAFDEREGQRLSLLDKTEFENPHFRYSL